MSSDENLDYKGIFDRHFGKITKITDETVHYEVRDVSGKLSTRTFKKKELASPYRTYKILKVGKSIADQLRQASKGQPVFVRLKSGKIIFGLFKGRKKGSVLIKCFGEETDSMLLAKDAIDDVLFYYNQDSLIEDFLKDRKLQNGDYVKIKFRRNTRNEKDEAHSYLYHPSDWRSHKEVAFQGSYFSIPGRSITDSFVALLVDSTHPDYDKDFSFEESRSFKYQVMPLNTLDFSSRRAPKNRILFFFLGQFLAFEESMRNGKYSGFPFELEKLEIIKAQE